MVLEAIGYFVFRTAKWNEWLQFNERLVRAHVDKDEAAGWARLRLDDRVQRILIERCPAEEQAVIAGLQVEDAATLEQWVARLAQHGVPVTAGNATETERRGVDRFVWFRDPDGNRLEIYVGLQAAGSPLQFIRPIGGFRTGALGAGHLVMATKNFAVMSDFFLNVLGLKISDFCLRPFHAQFMFLNGRHHSFAFIEANWSGVQHLMLEYLEWDDVGRAYDVALVTPEMIGQTLGRHANDHVTSFYVWSPDRFLFELGWGGRLVNADWQPEEITGPSLWGHERHWLSPEQRAEARLILDDYAARGVRAPLAPPTPDEFPDRSGEPR